MSIEALDCLKILGLCTFVIFLKYQVTIVLQGGRRTRAPEDGFQPKSMRNANETTALAGDSGTGNAGFDEEKRWQRIVMNDLENVLMGISLHWFAFIAHGDYTVTTISILAFTLGRLTHTVCYIWALMPWRSIAWLIGVLASLTASINMVYGVFNYDR